MNTVSAYRVTLLFFLLAAPSLAYVDPGTAGLIFQFGYMVFASIAAALAFFFRPIKALFLKMIGRSPKPTVEDLEDDDLDLDEPKNTDS